VMRFWLTTICGSIRRVGADQEERSSSLADTTLKQKYD
jgi:hypothetical protein